MWIERRKFGGLRTEGEGVIRSEEEEEEVEKDEGS